MLTNTESLRMQTTFGCFLFRRKGQKLRAGATEGVINDRMQKLEVREQFFEDDGRIPNNPKLPLLVYPGVLWESHLSPSRCKELLVENGWGGAWVNSVFSYHH